MIRRTTFAWLTVVLSVAGCGTPTNTPDGGADAAVQPTALFMGSYTATSDISVAMSAVHGCDQIVVNADMNQWDAADTATTGSTAVGELMTRVDREFIGDAAATSDYSIARTVRRGVTLGRAATTEAERDVAKETTIKPMIVALSLAVDSEVTAAIADAEMSHWDSARTHWDRAAAYYTGIEPDVRDYQGQMLTGVWGANNNALATDNIAETTIDLLRRGRGAIDANSLRSVVELGNQTMAYLTRLYFLSGVKYSTNIENAVRAGTEIDPGAPPEGTYAFEGVILPFLGRSTAPAVATARAHWRAAPMTITKLQLLRDAAALYVQMNSAPIEVYVGARDNDRWALIARMTGEIDALAEALTFSGQTPASLRTQLVSARTLSEQGDQTGATAQLNQVQAAIMRVGSAD